MNNSNMIVTIVTVSFNAGNSIEKTIRSVLSQSYKSLEYIVLDGGSRDDTLEIISKYVDSITYFDSQKDDGLYFAMNKGISLAHGDYILFLNCGDSLYNDRVIEDLVAYIEKQPNLPDVIYGNVVQERDFGDLLISPLPIEQICHRMVFSHQACFVKRKVLCDNLFDIRFRFVADYNQLSTLYLKGNTFNYFNRIISRIEVNAGISYENQSLCFKELMKINREPFASYTLLTYLKCVFTMKIRSFIISIIPKCLLSKYYQYKYRDKILNFNF